MRRGERRHGQAGGPQQGRAPLDQKSGVASHASSSNAVLIAYHDKCTAWFILSNSGPHVLQDHVDDLVPRRVASARAELMSRLKMVEKVARLATLKMPSALIVMCSSIGSMPRLNAPVFSPRARMRLQRVDHGDVQLADRLRALHVHAAHDVLVHDQPHELGMRLVIVEGRGDQRAKRLLRRLVLQLERRFLLADRRVGRLRAPRGKAVPCCRSSSRSCACWCACDWRSRRPARR